MSDPEAGAVARSRRELAAALQGTSAWAELAVELSHRLAENDHGLTEAIHVSKEILEVFSAGEEYETALLNLAADLSRRYLVFGDIADLREAIIHGETSVQAASPAFAQAAASNLASRLLTAYEEGLAEGDLDRAVDLLDRARSMQTVDTGDYISATSNLATALRRRYERDGDHGDLERSLGLETEAIALVDDNDDEEVALRLANRSNLFHTMWEATGLLAHLHAARRDAEAACAVRSPQRDANARRLLTLAQIESKVAEVDDDSDLLATAAGRASQAADLIEADASAHANHLTSLASILFMQHLRGVEDALEDAITANEEALAKAPRGSMNWATAANETLVHLTERFEQTGNSADLHSAIGLGRDAAGVVTERASRGSILTNTAIALRLLHETSEPYGPELLDEALAAITEATTLAGPTSSHQPARLHTASTIHESRVAASATTAEAREFEEQALETARAALNHPASAASDRHIYLTQVASRLDHSTPAELDEAIDLLCEAFELAPEGAPAEPRILYTLGCRYQQRSAMDHARDGDLQKAVDCFDHVLALNYPAVSVHAGQQLGDIAFAYELWDQAEQAYELAIQHAQSNTDQRAERHDKERARFDIQGAGAAAALAAHRAGNDHAANLLERVAASLLNRPIPSTTPSGDTPVVHIADSPSGGLAVLTHQGTTRTAELPGLTTTAITETISKFRSAFEPFVGDEFAHWNQAVEHLLSFTWTEASRALAEHLGPFSAAALVPVGSCAGLPIETARNSSGDSLLHDTVLARTPSAALQLPPPQLPEHPAVVAHHGPAERRLEALHEEITALQGIWPTITPWGTAGPRHQSTGPRPLRSSRPATADIGAPDPALLQLLARTDLLHIACHYDIDRDDPRNSVLLLEPPIRLVDLTPPLSAAAPHVILSACDSGLIGERLPDEAIGAATALLAAGAGAVTAALWPLDDLSTPAFMTAFHRQLRQGLEPAAALNQTQRDFFEDPPMLWAPFIHVGVPPQHGKATP